MGRERPLTSEGEMPVAEARLRTSTWLAAAFAIAALIPVLPAAGQAPQPGAGGAPGGQGRGGPAAPGAGRGAASARAAAPVDLTGYWVSIVTEDWIERMSPDSPPSGVGRGGRGGLPGGEAPAAQAGAKPSDPCRAYAAGGSLRVPGRLNITWADDNTLKIDMDAGTQTRLLRFNVTAPPAGTPRTLQGYSVAAWDLGARGRGGRGGPAAPPAWGSLRVVTTNTTGGYLLSSRNTYSENAVLTEYFTYHRSLGTEYFTVTAVIEDGGGPQRITSSTFKKEPNGSKFAPTGCEIVR
jgi:hypothetical protein